MKEKIKTLQIIHIAFCAGLTLAYILIGDIQNLDVFSFANIDYTSYPLLLIPFAAIIGGNLLYKMQLKKTKKSDSYDKRFPIYQSASLVRWAMLEGAAFIVLFVLSEFILIGLVLIVYMGLLRPSESSMKRDFDLYSS